jgi:hypothetical protein
LGNQQLRSRLAILAGVLILAVLAGAWAWQTVTSVAIKTGTVDNQPVTPLMGCYTSADTGELVTDPVSGVALIEESYQSNNGRRVAVTWPPGWTGRRSGSEVEVLTPQGAVYMRTGTRVHLLGGFTWVDGSFLTCGGETLP